MSPRARAVAIAAVAAVVVSIFTGLVLRRRSMAARAPTALSFVFAWPKDTAYTYAFEWRGESRVRQEAVGGPSASTSLFEGRVDLAGDLVLRSYGKTGDAYLLGARFEGLTRRELVILGHAALPTDEAARAAFAGHEAFVEIAPTGELRRVYFANDAPPVFRHAMRAVLLTSQTIVRANGDAQWSTTESTPVGRGMADYVVVDAHPTVKRTRHAYDEVFAVRRALVQGDEDERGEATIVLDPAGHLSSLHETETIAVHPGNVDLLRAQTELTLTLRSVGRTEAADMPSLASLEAVGIDQTSSSAAAQKALLDQRIGGMTRDDLERDLLSFALVGSTADPSWLLRASGLLKKQPELCMDLVALFEDPKMNARGRGQLMDLLAGAGTDKAQEAMREALSSPVASKDPKTYDALLQRFSFVSHPTPETIAFLERATQESKKGDAQWAAAYALGGAAGNAMRAGDATTGPRYGEPMVRSLAAARTPDEKRAWLGALGNLGWKGSTASIVALTRDDDPAVRAASAWALRKVDTTEAKQGLMGLAHDRSPEVEARAFEALATRPMDDGDLAALSKVVVDGGTSPQADQSLLSLLAAHEDGGEPVAAMLRALLARNDGDKPFAASIRHALAAVTR